MDAQLLSHRAWSLRKEDAGSLTVIIPHRFQGEYWAVAKHLGTTPRKCSLTHGKAGAGTGVHGPAMRLWPWGSQPVGHPGSTNGGRLVAVGALNL